VRLFLPGADLHPPVAGAETSRPLSRPAHRQRKPAARKPQAEIGECPVARAPAVGRQPQCFTWLQRRLQRGIALRAVEIAVAVLQGGRVALKSAVERQQPFDQGAALVAAVLQPGHPLDHRIIQVARDLHARRQPAAGVRPLKNGLDDAGVDAPPVHGRIPGLRDAADRPPAIEKRNGQGAGRAHPFSQPALALFHIRRASGVRDRFGVHFSCRFPGIHQRGGSSALIATIYHAWYSIAVEFTSLLQVVNDLSLFETGLLLYANG